MNVESWTTFEGTVKYNVSALGCLYTFASPISTNEKLNDILIHQVTSTVNGYLCFAIITTNFIAIIVIVTFISLTQNRLGW